jgi:hypothetical protein
VDSRQQPSIDCVRDRQNAVGMLQVEHPLQHPGFMVHADPSQLADPFDTVALGALLRRNLWQVFLRERDLLTFPSALFQRNDLSLQTCSLQTCPPLGRG